MKASWLTRALGIVLGIIFVLPTLIVIASSFTEGTRVTFPPKGFSFRWFEETLTSPLWMGSMINSLQVAFLAALIAAAVGISLALAATRARGPIRNLFVVLGVTPMIVPLVVMGIGVFLVILSLKGQGNIVILALAHAVLGVPFCFTNVLAALKSINPQIEEAARVCGASNLATLFRITLPQILPATLVGSLFAFVTSWDEVVVAIFVNTPTFRTLPVVIWGEVRAEFSPTISAIATIVTVISVLVMALSSLASTLIARRRNAH